MHVHNLGLDQIELSLCDFVVVYLCLQEGVDDVVVDIQP